MSEDVCNGRRSMSAGSEEGFSIDRTGDCQDRNERSDDWRHYRILYPKLYPCEVVLGIFVRARLGAGSDIERKRVVAVEAEGRAPDFEVGRSVEERGMDIQ